jgi:hypothetical protein
LGGGAAAKSLEELGLRLGEITALKPEDQFTAIADRLGKIADPTKKAALAMNLFGRSGTELLPMLDKGSKGIGELRAECQRLGLTMSTKDAKAAKEFGDELTRVREVAKRAAFEVGQALAPALKDAFEWIIKTTQSLRSFTLAHESFIRSALKAAAAVTAIGGALFVVGKIAKGTGALMAGALAVGAHPLVALGIVGAGVITAEVVALRNLAAARRENTRSVKEAQEAAQGFDVDTDTSKLEKAIADRERIGEQIRKERDALKSYGTLWGMFFGQWHGNLNELAQQHKDLTDAIIKMGNALRNPPPKVEPRTDRATWAEGDIGKGMALARSDLARVQSIEELTLRTKFQGLKLEEEMLKLEYRRAWFAAKSRGENLGLVQKEYQLRLEMLGMNSRPFEVRQDLSNIQMKAQGSFSGRAVESFGVQSLETNVTKKQAQDISMIRTDIRNLLGVVRQRPGAVFS